MANLLRGALGFVFTLLLFGGAFLCIKLGVGFMAYLTLCIGGAMMATLASVSIDHLEVKA